MPRVIPIAVYIIFSERSYRPAPKFCAIIADAAFDIVLTTKNGISLSFILIALPADAATPYVLIVYVTTINEIPATVICTAHGNPIFIIFPRTLP